MTDELTGYEPTMSTGLISGNEPVLGGLLQDGRNINALWLVRNFEVGGYDLVAGHMDRDENGAPLSRFHITPIETMMTITQKSIEDRDGVYDNLCKYTSLISTPGQLDWWNLPVLDSSWYQD